MVTESDASSVGSKHSYRKEHLVSWIFIYLFTFWSDASRVVLLFCQMRGYRKRNLVSTDVLFNAKLTVTESDMPSMMFFSQPPGYSKRHPINDVLLVSAVPRSVLHWIVCEDVISECNARSLGLPSKQYTVRENARPRCLSLPNACLQRYFVRAEEVLLPNARHLCLALRKQICLFTQYVLGSLGESWRRVDLSLKGAKVENWTTSSTLSQDKRNLTTPPPPPPPTTTTTMTMTMKWLAVLLVKANIIGWTDDRKDYEQHCAPEKMVITKMIGRTRKCICSK